MDHVTGRLFTVIAHLLCIGGRDQPHVAFVGPELGEVLHLLLITQGAEAHTVDIDQIELVVAALKFGDEDVSRRVVVVQDTLFMQVGSELAELSEYLVMIRPVGIEKRLADRKVIVRALREKKTLF